MYKIPSLTKIAQLSQSDDCKKTIDKLYKAWKEAYKNRSNTCFGLNNYISVFRAKDMSFTTFSRHVDTYYLEYLIPKLLCDSVSSKEQEQEIFGSLIYRGRLNCRKDERIVVNASDIIYSILSEVFDHNIDMLDEFFENIKPIEKKQKQLGELDFNITDPKQFKNIEILHKIVDAHSKDLDEVSVTYLKNIVVKYHIWLHAITWEDGPEKYHTLVNLLFNSNNIKKKRGRKKKED
jgi:hypothetical protein